MPAYTSFLTLYKPGGGSTGLIVPDEVVDIDRLNANSDLIDAFAAGWGHAAERNHNLYGPAASLSAVTGMKRGDTYQESDANFVAWKFNGSNWVTDEGGLVLIRPTSVIGGTIGPNGHITSTPGNAATIQANGVFSDRFRTVRMIASIRLAASAPIRMRFAAGGVAQAAANYVGQGMVGSGAAVTAGAETTATSLAMDGVNSVNKQIVADFLSTRANNSVQFPSFVSNTFAQNGVGTGNSFHTGAYNVGNTVFDGLLLIGGPTGAVNFDASVDIAFYGFI